MTKPTHLKVALVQQSNTDNAKTIWQNQLLVFGMQQAKAKLIVLQELHRSLYFCQTEDVDVLI